ncbi:hypothetical protein [Streptomyces sp. NPDC002845]
MIPSSSAAEVVVHTQPTGTGCTAAHTHKYGTGKLPIELADGRAFALDLDELPHPGTGDRRSLIEPVIGAMRTAACCKPPLALVLGWLEQRTSCC